MVEDIGADVRLVVGLLDRGMFVGARDVIVRLVGEDPGRGLAVLACVLDRVAEEVRSELRRYLMRGVSCADDGA
jgi:hypothetical protein